MRAKSWAPGVVGVVLVGLLAGCGGMHGMDGMKPGGMSSSTAVPRARHTMPDGTVMDGKSMPHGSSHPAASDSRPSAGAAMICADDTAGAVETTFGLKSTPRRTAIWSAPVYSCRYALPGGELRLTVADLDGARPGRAWFDKLRNRLPAARTLTGMENLGFPAYETATGDVVFLKDHKTLWVDASRVRASELPGRFSRTDAAYHVAAAVIACWSE